MLSLLRASLRTITSKRSIGYVMTSKYDSVKLNQLFSNKLAFPGICDVEDVINTGFAFLCANQNLFTSEACEFFFTAKKLDKEKQYSKVITHGLKQIGNPRKELELLGVVHNGLFDYVVISLTYNPEELSELYNDTITCQGIIGVEDAINKGFAYLAANPELFAYDAYGCFLEAKQLDINKKYSQIINIGLGQVNSSEELQLLGLKYVD